MANLIYKLSNVDFMLKVSLRFGENKYFRKDKPILVKMMWLFSKHQTKCKIKIYPNISKIKMNPNVHTWIKSQMSSD